MNKSENGKKHAGGRPTSYKPEYCEAILKFFSVERFKETKETVTTAKGTVIEKPVRIMNELPTLERFAATLGVSTETVKNWTRHFPAFNEAFTRAKELQKDFIVQAGFSGMANPVFAKFTAINMTDMRDKTEVEHSGLEDTLAAIRAKKKGGN